MFNTRLHAADLPLILPYIYTAAIGLLLIGRYRVYSLPILSDSIFKEMELSILSKFGKSVDLHMPIFIIDQDIVKLVNVTQYIS